MSAPLRKALLLLLFPAGLAAFFLAAYLSFYSGGGYTPPEAPDIAFAAAVSYPVETTAFTDDPVFDTAIAADRGLLLVDFAHRNAFYPGGIGPPDRPGRRPRLRNRLSGGSRPTGGSGCAPPPPCWSSCPSMPIARPPPPP